MSKSLYQFQIDPNQQQQIETLLNQALFSEKYKNKMGTKIYTYGSGWLTSQRRIEYTISGNILSICAWKVLAIIVPMLEIGSLHLDSFYGFALNSISKNAVERITRFVGQYCTMIPTQVCVKVDDSFLDRLGMSASYPANYNNAVNNNIPANNNIPMYNNVPVNNNIPVYNNVPVNNNVPVDNNIPVYNNVPVNNNTPNVNRVCPNCCQPLEIDAFFCSNCGTRIS